ncbi:MAG: endonuclease VIII [Coriobacteriia bacterium]|nr:endonuclease VIII [Coriobacteriia bacterium]
MIEIPEAVVLSRQFVDIYQGKKIVEVIAAQSPHKFAWYYKDPSAYPAKLVGKSILDAYPMAGRVEVVAGDCLLNFGEGAVLRHYAAGEMVPNKHQLFVGFEDGSALLGTVAMYGMFMCFYPGENDEDKFYMTAKTAISPLAEGFDKDYFNSLIDEKTTKLSAKAFLATEQRIPGLGNGVLQDILFNARIHPKRKINSLTEDEVQALFISVKETLQEMVDCGGRDTEKDLYGEKGGYTTKMSRFALDNACPECFGSVTKETYLGGTVYYCKSCQKTQ